MSISDYFSGKFGGGALPGQGDYSSAFKNYGSADLWRPKIGGLDMGTPILPGSPGSGTVTGSVDGGAPAVDWLKGLTTAVLSNMGAQSEPEPRAAFQPVAYSSGDDGGMPWGLIALGAVAVGAVVYAAQGK